MGDVFGLEMGVKHTFSAEAIAGAVSVIHATFAKIPDGIPP
jgi:hypothetical protein